MYKYCTKYLSCSILKQRCSLHKTKFEGPVPLFTFVPYFKPKVSMTKRKLQIILSAIVTAVVLIGLHFIPGIVRNRTNKETEPLRRIVDVPLRKYMDGNKDILRAVVSIKRTGHTKGPWTFELVRYDDNKPLGSTDLITEDRPLVPGGIMQAATIAFLMDNGGLQIDERFPTCHGELPGTEIDYHVVYYEKTTGKDSVSVREGFLFSSRYCIGKAALETPYFQHAFEERFGDYFGSSTVQETQYPPADTPSNRVALASGRGVVLSSRQVVTFYDAIACHGVRSRNWYTRAKRICSRMAADTVKVLLAQNVMEGTGKFLSDCRSPIAGKTGSGRLENGFRSDGRAIETSSFAGFFPAASPRYTMCVTIYRREALAPGTATAMRIYEEIVTKMDGSGMIW